MSGRRRSIPYPRLARPAVAAGWLVGCALMVAAGPAAAQPSALPPPPAEGVDDRPPIPPETSKRAELAARVPIDKDRAIFTGTRGKDGVVRGGIQDDRPLASEKQNADEYQALTAVVLHANQFTAADLEPLARRDLTPDDLRYGSVRDNYRLDLIRFEGKLTKARRIRATRALEETGLTELTEVWLVPDDESPGNAVCLLLTGWPAELPKLPEITAGQAAGESVTLDHWASAAGYSFKLMTYPGPDADPKTPTGRGWLKAPLLIGPSVIPAAEPAPRVELDKGLRVFKRIPDDTHNNAGGIWEERTAWNRVVLHARKFTTEQLEAAAARGLVFADLFEEHRADHKLDLVHFRGRLIRLTEAAAGEQLASAGIPVVYEGWLVPDGEPRGNPVCVILSELPPGLAPQRSMSVPVGFAGYSFKRMRYTSQEQQKDDPSKYVPKAAPLLIGRSVTVLAEPDGPNVWSATFIPVVLGCVLGLIGIAVGMSWWFRRGDTQARAEIDAARGNPFSLGQ